MDSYAIQKASIKASAERFAEDTKHHELTIKHDDGLYRHLHFQRPGSSGYWFDLVTWPGKLALVGDCDGFTFSRLTDMFEFFRSRAGWNQGINPGYWAEKIVDGRDRSESYSEELFRAHVAEHLAEVEGEFPGAMAAWAAHIDDGYFNPEYEDAAREALNDFKFLPEGAEGKPFTFTDTWEWSFKDFDHWFLWACHAIVAGIEQYDAAKAEAARPVETAPVTSGAVS